MPSRPFIRVKICGITSRQDALLAVASGADALGFMLYSGSPRHVDLDTATALVEATPPMVSRVGVFVNADGSWIEEVLEHLPLSLLQFHGDEAEGDCSRWNRPYIKAVRVKDADSVLSAVERYQSAAGFLLDSHVDAVLGGSGEVFDWSLLPKIDKPVILAGGLRPDNVLSAIEQVRPFAVDVSSGVESAPGIKDPRLVREFMDRVKG